MIYLAFYNLFRNKSRTVLSLLGIVIGVTAIIVLVALVDGMFADVQNAIGQMQGITVLEDGAQGPLFSRIDLSFKSEIEGLQGIRAVVPQIIDVATSVEGEKTELGFSLVRLYGIDYVEQQKSDSFPIAGEVVQGRDLKPDDKGAVVVGELLMDEYNKFLGNSINVNGESYRIVGVYRTGSSLLNTSILFTFDDLKELLEFPDGKASTFNINLVNSEQDKKIVSLINFKFGEELEAKSASDFSDMFGDFINSFRLLVIAVAAISAIVAGVGIINTMLMSVLERFKEIGSLKAIGWTESNVLQMVLYESIFVGVLGGLAGVFSGIALAYFLGFWFALNVVISLSLLVWSFAFAVVLGLLAGLYPAWMASKMDPIEALRME